MKAHSFSERMRKATDQELIGFFNREVGNTGWGNARADYLAALHEEIKSRNFDSSIIISKKEMSLRKKVVLNGNKMEFVEVSF